MGTENWARNIAFGETRLARPATAEEVADLVATHPTVRVVGAGHSFNDICSTSGLLLDLANLNRVIDIDGESETVTVEGGIRYDELCRALHDAGWALHNQMSIPHFSVAGACSTAAVPPVCSGYAQTGQ